MLTLQEIKALLDQGKTEEVLKATEELLTTGQRTIPAEEMVKEVLALRAWAHYRRKEFDRAEEEAKKARNNETALRCLAAIAAYHHKDSVLMRTYIDQLPESPARDNTLMIYAREPSDTTLKEEILARALKWAVVDPADRTNTANLLNNTARWFLAKAQNKEDLVMALGFMQAAIGVYGTGSVNLHHRASAWYWVSVMQEKLLGKAASLSACEVSAELWEKQVKADPTNFNFQKSLEGAKKRLEELRGDAK